MSPVKVPSFSLSNSSILSKGTHTVAVSLPCSPAGISILYSQPRNSKVSSPVILASKVLAVRSFFMMWMLSGATLMPTVCPTPKWL